MMTSASAAVKLSPGSAGRRLGPAEEDVDLAGAGGRIAQHDVGEPVAVDVRAAVVVVDHRGRFGGVERGAGRIGEGDQEALVRLAPEIARHDHFHRGRRLAGRQRDGAGGRLVVAVRLEGGVVRGRERHGHLAGDRLRQHDREDRPPTDGVSLSRGRPGDGEARAIIPSVVAAIVRPVRLVSAVRLVAVVGTPVDLTAGGEENRKAESSDASHAAEDRTAARRFQTAQGGSRSAIGTAR